MFISAVPRFLAGLLLAVLTCYSHAAEIEERNVVIVSDGVSLHADVYYAKADTKAPCAAGRTNRPTPIEFRIGALRSTVSATDRTVTR